MDRVLKGDVDRHWPEGLGQAMGQLTPAAGTLTRGYRRLARVFSVMWRPFCTAHTSGYSKRVAPASLRMASSLGKEADTIHASFDFAAWALGGRGSVQRRAIGLRERQAGEDVFFCLVNQRGGLG